MKSILQDEKVCYISGATTNLHKHHVYEAYNRKNSEKYGFYVYLRADLHNLSSNGVHFNRELDLELKRLCQAKFEESHTREEFLKIIGKNYL